MLKIEVVRKEVNLELLDQQLKTALTGSVYGVSLERELVAVYVDDKITQSAIDLVKQIVIRHDATQLTSEQERALILQDDVIAARETFPDDLVVDGITLLDLARRVAWLEKELRLLRGL